MAEQFNNLYTNQTSSVPKGSEIGWIIEEQSLAEVDPTTLSSQKKYFCTKHKEKEAHCFCVKCGSMLCNDCGMLVRGRRYCQTCLLDDDQLMAEFQQDFLKPKILEAAIQLQACRPPKRFRDLPRAIANMFRHGSVFFVTAKDSAYHLTFYLAALALIPNSLVAWFMHRDEILTSLSPEIQPLFQQILAQTDLTQALFFVLIALIQVLLFDLFYWLSIRLFTTSEMSFIQAGNILNFCLLPLILLSVCTYFGLNTLPYVVLFIMIALVTRATRNATQCTFFQGLGVMTTFIIFSTMVGLFSR